MELAEPVWRLLKLEPVHDKGVTEPSALATELLSKQYAGRFPAIHHLLFQLNNISNSMNSINIGNLPVVFVGPVISIFLLRFVRICHLSTARPWTDRFPEDPIDVVSWPYLITCKREKRTPYLRSHKKNRCEMISPQFCLSVSAFL